MHQTITPKTNTNIPQNSTTPHDFNTPQNSTPTFKHNTQCNNKSSNTSTNTIIDGDLNPSNFTIFSQTNTKEASKDTDIAEAKQTHPNNDYDNNDSYNSTLSQIHQLLQDKRASLEEPPIPSITITKRYPIRSSIRTIIFNCNKGLRGKIHQAAEHACKAATDILYIIEPYDHKATITSNEVARHKAQAMREGYELYSSKYSLVMLKKTITQNGGQANARI